MSEIDNKCVFPATSEIQSLATIALGSTKGLPEGHLLEYDLGLRLLSRTMPVLDAVGTQNAALRELVSMLVLDTLTDLNHRTVVTGMRRQWAMVREAQIRLGLG